MQLLVRTSSGKQRTVYNAALSDLLKRRSVTLMQISEAQDRVELFGPPSRDTYEDGSLSVDATRCRATSTAAKTTEILQRSSNTILDAQRAALETEVVGHDVIRELREQRETIERSHSNLRSSGKNVEQGSNLIQLIQDEKDKCVIS